MLQVEKRIRTRVKRQIEKGQRENYLYEQLKAIQKELGDEEGRSEVAEIEDIVRNNTRNLEHAEIAGGRFWGEADMPRPRLGYPPHCAAMRLLKASSGHAITVAGVRSGRE